MNSFTNTLNLKSWNVGLKIPFCLFFSLNIQQCWVRCVLFYFGISHNFLPCNLFYFKYTEYLSNEFNMECIGGIFSKFFN